MFYLHLFPKSRFGRIAWIPSWGWSATNLPPLWYVYAFANSEKFKKNCFWVHWTTHSRRHPFVFTNPMISGQKGHFGHWNPKWHGIYRRVSEHLPGICRSRRREESGWWNDSKDPGWVLAHVEKIATFAGHDDDDDDDDDDDHEPHSDNSKM